MDVVLLFHISLAVFLLFKFRNYYASKSHRHPPGPRGLLLIGNMHQFDSSNTHLYLFELSQKYCPLVSLKLGSVQTLVISSVTAAKEVFKYHDLCFLNRPAFVGARKLSYNGLDLAFAPYNEYWRNMKKICNLHLFSSKRSHSFHLVREEEVAHMIKTIRDRATSADCNIINVRKTVMTIASLVILRITFGRRYDDAGLLMIIIIMSSRIHWLLAESRAYLVRFFARDYFPIMGFLIDRLGGASARLEKTFNELDAIYQQIIDEHLHASNLSSQESSILDILLQMKMDSPDFTFNHIKAVLVVIMAGVLF